MEGEQEEKQTMINRTMPDTYTKGTPFTPELIFMLWSFMMLYKKIMLSRTEHVTGKQGFWLIKV
ncbi:hypothetical protein A4R26_25405 [Niastella populi]|uniref:Transposase DDE domain-containing protein n=1 Tax=Niastella populi TaxID=550983 RepID=A0A1V9FET9_9BACT|nr:hypothetical protein A4R26_25405 [Niastella populi]